MEVFECFCFICDVFHDGAMWCMMCGADPFSHCSIFLTGFFHGVFLGTPLKFADLLWCHWLPLWLCDYTMQVRLLVLCVCLCVSLQPIMIRLFVLELVVQFWSFYTLLLICFGWESVGLTMQISPFLNGNIFTRLLFLQLLVDKIGCINHAWFSWEPLCLADPWLIAQLSLLFLYYVFSLKFVT